MSYPETNHRIQLPVQISEDHLLDLSFDAIAVIGPDDRIQYWNRGAVETYGYSPDEAFGRFPHELLKTESEIPIDQLLALLKSKGRWSGELTHTRKDGKKVVVSSRWSLSRDGSGIPHSVLQVDRDITEQKNVERALRENEQRLRSHMENTPLAVIEWGPDYRLSRWSSEAEHIFGWSADEVLGKRIDEFRWVFEGDEGTVTEIGTGLVNGTRSRSVSRNRNYRKDGSVIHCEWYNSSIVDECGKLVSIFSLVLDVTERSRAEDALRIRTAALAGSETKFRTMAESIPQLVWTCDSSGACDYVGHRWLEFTGTTTVQNLGYGWSESLHPDDRGRVALEWQECVRQMGALDTEFRLRRFDGEFRWFLTRAVPFLGSEGEPRWFGTSTDITDQKKAEEEIRNNQERLQIALAASQTGTFRWDPNTDEYLEFDQNLKILFGRPDQPFVTTDDFIRCVHGDDLPELKRKLEACKEGGDFEMEYRVILPNGQVRWLYDRGRMEFENEQPKYLVGACTDISRRKHTEYALLRSEKLAAAGRLASTIAHEINNPLEAVVNLLYLVKNDPLLPAVTKNYLNAAEAEVNRVSQMSKRTLSFYRSESNPQRFMVANVIEDVLRLFSPILRNHNIELSKRLDQRAETVGLSSEIRQVCTNLVSNAIDARPRFLSIRVSRLAHWKDEAKGAVRITVADDGSGVAPGLLKQIFEPFFTTKAKTGTGLGLWVCREIIRNHEGSIRVRSISGRGTVFSIYLPMVECKSREALLPGG